jgi:hypothetical protein
MPDGAMLERPSASGVPLQEPLHIYFALGFSVEEFFQMH